MDIEQIFAAIAQHKAEYKAAYEAMEMFRQCQEAMRIAELARSPRIYIDMKTTNTSRGYQNT